MALLTRSDFQGSEKQEPAVRDGFKRTEIGLIPADWRIADVGSLFDASAGGDLHRAQYSSVQSQSHQFPIYANGIERKGLYGFSSDANWRPGCITVTARGTLGKAIYRDTSFVAIGRLLVLEPIVSMDARFFAEFIDQRVNFAVESTGVPQLTAPQIARYVVPVPPETEQRAIADALSDMDKLVDASEALIAKKQDIKRTSMHQLLIGKTRLPGFSDPWNVTTIGMIGSIYGGLSGKNKDDFGKGAARYITFMNIMEHVLIRSNHTEHVRVEPSETQNRVLNGDLLFNGTSETPNELALGAVVDEEVDDMYLNSFCFGFRLHDSESCYPLYLAYFLRDSAGRSLVRGLSQGATRYNLSKTQFLSLEMRMPPLREQRKIAHILKDMDAEIVALEQRRAKTLAIKQGMMQELLAGRTRLV